MKTNKRTKNLDERNKAGKDRGLTLSDFGTYYKAKIIMLLSQS